MSENRLELLVASFLWWGTILSALIIGTGMALALFQGGNTGYPHGIYPTSPIGILHGIQELRPGAIQSLGFVVLIGIPVGRILLLSWGYLLRKEYFLMVMSWMALGVIATGLMLGVAH